MGQAPKSLTEIKQNKYEIILNLVTSQGGATFGRFSDLYTDKQRQALCNFLEKEESLLNHLLFVESSYIPKNVKAGNVACHLNLRRNAIDVSKGESSKNISLENIYVGANLSRLYLTTPKGEQELFITSSNLLNHQFAPDPIRFMREVSKMRFVSIHPWSWSSLQKSPFLPRVIYKGVILSRKTWFLDGTKFDNLKDQKKLYAHFSSWSEKWKVPQFISIGFSDQRLLLDRFHPSFKEIITQNIQKYKIIHITETFSNNWVQSDKGNHYCEFVLPIRKKNKYREETSSSLTFQNFSFEKRVKLPGDEWLFFKIYLEEDGYNHFLVHKLSPFLSKLVEKKILEKWFFIRYTDPNNHIRVRVKGPKLGGVFLPLLNEWIKENLISNYIHDFCISPYHRELERYGGKDVIEFAEEYFCKDTSVCLNLIAAQKKGFFSLPEPIIGTLSVLNLVKNYSMTFDETLHYLKYESTDKRGLEGIRKWNDKEAVSS